MKALAAVALASVIAVAGHSPAEARQGCGPGLHRAPNGMCRPNRGQVVYVVGRYYPSHGWWYNGRWWRHRYRWHHGWRYR